MKVKGKMRDAGRARFGGTVKESCWEGEKMRGRASGMMVREDE